MTKIAVIIRRLVREVAMGVKRTVPVKLNVPDKRRADLRSFVIGFQIGYSSFLLFRFLSDVSLPCWQVRVVESSDSSAVKHHVYNAGPGLGVEYDWDYIEDHRKGGLLDQVHAHAAERRSRATANC
jgi:hypothetical protein